MSARTTLLRLAAVLATSAACAADAAPLTVTLTDPAGKPLAGAVVLVEATGARPTVKPLADAELSQAGKAFHPRVTLITVGTRVHFPNFDTVRHHVYSFSPIKPFELKLYAGVPSQPVTFDKPGVAVLGCNIHDQMAAWVVVADTPWFARSGDDGRARIDDLPAGSYKLRAWHPGLGPGERGPEQALTIGGANASVALRLAVAAP